MVKRQKEPPFVKVPLWWAEAAAKATRMPGMLVLVELLHRSWKAKSLTFPLPNGRLAKHGVSREIKRRVAARSRSRWADHGRAASRQDPAGDARGTLTVTGRHMLTVPRAAHVETTNCQRATHTVSFFSFFLCLSSLSTSLKNLYGSR